MQNIIVTGMQVTSVFIPTAIAALLFPYMKRVQGRVGLLAVQDVDVARPAGRRVRRAVGRALVARRPLSSGRLCG